MLATRVPWTRLTLVAVLAAAAPAAIALEAWRATRLHRDAAERALRDYAGSAATAFRDQYISRLYFAVDGIFEPVVAGAARGGGLPDPHLLRLAAVAMQPCNGCGAILRPGYFFRLTLADSALTIDGPPLPPGRRAELITRIPVFPPDLPPRWYTSFVDTLGPAPEVVYLAPRKDAAGRPVAVYGFVVGLHQLADAVLRPLLDQVGLVPRMAPAKGRNDSLLSVSILEPRGRRAVELSPRRLPPTYSAGVPTSRFLGNWTLHLALDPVAAPPFLVGGLPPTRAIPLALMALVTAALVTVSVLVAWRAHELARLRTDFVASVSHELRTPLAQIHLFGESLALGRMRARQDVRAAGRVVLAEARRLLQLVENVLLFGRGVRLVPAPPYAPLLLAPLVHETLESFAPLAAGAAAQVRTVRLDETYVPAEPGALRQVLLNLLDNAAKYGPPGQTISVGLALLDGSARIWVEDEGPGIPPGDRERVFEPFVRLLRDVSSSAAGSGIGLALVRDLVTLHGGTVRIETASTGGARVVVELPNAEPVERTCAS
jgi:signal transduction histidine kinase